LNSKPRPRSLFKQRRLPSEFQHGSGHCLQTAHFLYLSYEDHVDEVTRRTQAITRRLNLHLDEAPRYWDLTSKSPPLATISENGIEIQPFWTELRTYLLSISGPKFVVADSTYNLLQFTGAAKINETSVKMSIELLNRLCHETDTTLLMLWHPSQSGQERGDASGWSVAWHNTPRARLSLAADKDHDGVIELKVEKRNNGPKGKPITLHWSDGALLPLSETASEEQSSLFLEGCIKVAKMAADNDAPIQKQRRLDGWMIGEIERAAGRKPSDRDVKEELARAIMLGRLRYQRGHGKQTAGYFPIEQSKVT
jgi:hypothetical protein